jgi:hypothetical protein
MEVNSMSPVLSTTAVGQPVVNGEFEQKVEAAKKRVMELQKEDRNLVLKIESLKDRCRQFCIEPNLAVPVRFGVVVSNAPEPLGGLETQIFQIQKDIRYHSAVVDGLEEQIAVAKEYPNSQFMQKVEDAKKELNRVESKNADLLVKIESLKERCRQLGIHPNLAGIPFRLGVIVSNDPQPLGGIKTKIFAVQKDISHNLAVVDRLEKQIAAAEKK